MAEKKTCFIITPIGEEGSETRQHIDDVIDEIVIPAFQDKYEIIPPHRINKIGNITEDVLAYLSSSDLVVANLTGLNTNVMYELGYRHCVGKPVISIAEKGTKPPFDIQNDRTFYYEYSIEGLAKLREQLVEVEGNIDYNKSQKSGMSPFGMSSLNTETTSFSPKKKSLHSVNIKPDSLKTSWYQLNRFEEIITPALSKRFDAHVSFTKNNMIEIEFLIVAPLDNCDDLYNFIRHVAHSVDLIIVRIDISSI